MANESASKLAASRILRVFYWVLTLGLLFIACRFLYSTQRPIAAILVFLSGLLGIFFYYVKWFILPEKTQPWPPFVTPCPDYLTMVDPGDGKSKPTKCLDFIGVSDNGILKRADPANAKKQMNDPNFAFSVLRDGKTGTLDKICADVRAKGLTWSSLCPENDN